MAYVRKKDGVFYYPSQGRLMQHEHYAVRIHWSRGMLDYLRANFATTLNQELAECLGVGHRTMIRKARELGLEKDREWLLVIWNERRRMAQSASRLKGHPGAFKKGCQLGRDYRFRKGHTLTPEQQGRRRVAMRKWYRSHPAEARAKALKAWETRRARALERIAEEEKP